MYHAILHASEINTEVNGKHAFDGPLPEKSSHQSKWAEKKQGGPTPVSLFG